MNRTEPLYPTTGKDASGCRLVATPGQLRALLASWRQQGVDLEPERLVDVLPLLAEFYEKQEGE